MTDFVYVPEPLDGPCQYCLKGDKLGFVDLPGTPIQICVDCVTDMHRALADADAQSS